jgi:hypothetical protein
MARPADPNTAVPLMTRVSADMAQQMRSLAADENCTVAEVVRGLLRASLNQRDAERDQMALDFPATDEGSSAA